MESGRGRASLPGSAWAGEREGAEGNKGCTPANIQAASLPGWPEGSDGIQHNLCKPGLLDS